MFTCHSWPSLVATAPPGVSEPRPGQTRQGGDFRMVIFIAFLFVFFKGINMAFHGFLWDFMGWLWTFMGGIWDFMGFYGILLDE